MNKTELVAAVAQKAELSKKDAEKAVAAVTAAIEEYFGSVVRGAPVFWFRTLAAANVPGLTKVTLTLNGATDDVYPANSTNILIPVFV